MIEINTGIILRFRIVLIFLKIWTLICMYSNVCSNTTYILQCSSNYCYMTHILFKRGQLVKIISDTIKFTKILKLSIKLSKNFDVGFKDLCPMI